MSGKVKCSVCGYVWKPKVKNPVSCAKCKRYDWNKKLK